ncbi:4-phosphoerythronate dehydrogenase [Shewanella sp. SR44-3]|uniref:4-phosphoerythronate dehydrogenase n=1 Tax=unclassified Shewanella TaxID=196818 RepID=UPI0015FE76CB|nr:4-phosphoerythronate dehydrogenase [Shewanella sp. SR44-3]MBB1270333.1 4-phosphoerythronate dehydrogenase [Shewanella sp. SR44-3]
MKIVADENMPFVQALFGELGDVVSVNGRSLSAKDLKDADVLLVRSVTKVDQALLQDCTSLKFVGSATIGTDHIDQDYLKHRDIPFANAPGCNATGVGEYAFIAALELAEREQVNLKDKVIGIVGAGNTGLAAAKCFSAFGNKVVVCDPFKTQDMLDFPLVDLDELIQQADIISLHVPLTEAGPYKTWYLFDSARLESLRPSTWLFNCCRGEVIDNQALIKFKQRRDDIKLVLDVWQGEPHPMAALVPLTEFATPHIAGYSLEGKARGTFMLYQALAATLELPVNASLDELLPTHFVDQMRLATQTELTQGHLLSLARLVYDLRDDDRNFRQAFNQANGFDQLRKNHTHRREFSALTLASSGGCEVNWLLRLGFSGVGR